MRFFFYSLISWVMSISALKNIFFLNIQINLPYIISSLKCVCLRSALYTISLYNRLYFFLLLFLSFIFVLLKYKTHMVKVHYLLTDADLHLYICICIYRNDSRRALGSQQGSKWLVQVIRDISTLQNLWKISFF